MVVRLEKITIDCIKNVVHGDLSFNNILGLYGQNGSGKTTLIDAIEILQYALCGRQLPDKFSDYINVMNDSAMIQYEFSITDNDMQYRVFYGLQLCTRQVEPHSNTSTSHDRRVVIARETLSFSSTKTRKSLLIDTSSDKVFKPISQYNQLVGKNKDTELNLIIAKNMAKITSRSFIFSRELLTAMRRQKSQSMMLIESLVNYGNFELFVINTKNTGFILPISFKSNHAVGNILLSLGGVTAIPREAVNTVESVIDSMNVVLSQIVPGLTIGVKTLGDVLSEDGTRMVNIQLVSKKSEKMIPLQCESEGIKKIISVLQLLIVVYNKPSITVAIDELDAGVFEYLLGELLRIIADRGKGQLIFTSHNLRPLETLGREFIAFTTTDSNHRYVRFNRSSTSANLRDLYYRDIILGDKSEEIYNYTNNSEIAFAFREAGEMIGS